ncbi:MAG TPA: hypothetical protein VL371_26170 [Gemmataceae bacterium]|jgi:hypothetical protein|nr:hypothetical protein [Gemmataceae bacterium]
MVLKRIGVLSAAKVAGVMYAALGLVVGLVFAGMASLVPFASHESGVPSWLAPMFGVGALIAAPIFYGVMGFVMGAVSAVLYNLFAGLVGGLELDIEPTKSDAALSP